MEPKKSSLPTVLTIIVIVILVGLGIYILKSTPKEPVVNGTNTSQGTVDKNQLKAEASAELNAIGEDYSNPDFSSLDKGL
jgi:hypothetical protein